MTIYYSTDEETFNYESVDEAVECLIGNDSDIKVGDIVYVQSGESVAVSVKEYIPDILETISDNSYDEMGEFSDGFPDASKEVGQEIQTQVEDLVSKLFDKYKLNPSFYRIKNVKFIGVIITNLDGCQFEIVES